MKFFTPVVYGPDGRMQPMPKGGKLHPEALRSAALTACICAACASTNPDTNTVITSVTQSGDTFTIADSDGGSFPFTVTHPDTDDTNELNADASQVITVNNTDQTFTVPTIDDDGNAGTPWVWDMSALYTALTSSEHPTINMLGIGSAVFNAGTNQWDLNIPDTDTIDGDHVVVAQSDPDPDTGVVTTTITVTPAGGGTPVITTIVSDVSDPIPYTLKRCTGGVVSDITGNFVIRETCVDQGRSFFFTNTPVDSDSMPADNVRRQVLQGSFNVPNPTCYPLRVRIEGDIHQNIAVQRSYLWYMNLAINPDTAMGAATGFPVFGHMEHYWSGFETKRADPYSPEPRYYTVPPGGRDFHVSLNMSLTQQDTEFNPVLDPNLTKYPQPLVFLNWETQRNDCL